MFSAQPLPAARRRDRPWWWCRASPVTATSSGPSPQTAGQHRPARAGTWPSRSAHRHRRKVQAYASLCQTPRPRPRPAMAATSDSLSTRTAPSPRRSMARASISMRVKTPDAALSRRGKAAPTRATKKVCLRAVLRICTLPHILAWLVVCLVHLHAAAHTCLLARLLGRAAQRHP